MAEKKIIFELSPEDITESFGIACTMLGLDKKKEEASCLGRNKKKIDHEVIIKLSTKYGLKTGFDFHEKTGYLILEPLSDEINSQEDYEAMQDKEAQEAEKAMLDELKQSKELTKEDKAGVDMLDDDDF
jgi:hypothetical protein